MQPITLRLHPVDLLARWPRDRPVAALISADRSGGPFSRWSVLAQPHGWVALDRTPEGGWVRRSEGRVDIPADLPSDDPLAMFDLPPRDVDNNANPSSIPFCGGWIGTLSYELGRIIEPAAGSANRISRPSHWPLAAFAWCPEAVVYDHIAEQWWHVRCGESTHDRTLGAAIEADDRDGADVHGDTFSGELVARTSDEAHREAVSRAIEHIHAGDIFQANITRRYDVRLEGDGRDFAARALRSAQPRYGAYLELDDSRRLLSLSPELFLSLDGATRRVVTRPIKGTVGSTEPVATLRESAKDAAELHMIVDLMRNDLGRVCAFGSIRVDEPRMIETHAGVHHGVAQVSGTLRGGVSIAGLLRATFPAGSITGAPKIRAMQIIEELEDHPRDFYCGAIGFVDVRGHAQFNVAIRTMMIERSADEPRCALLTYGAGGGIVADSDPESELRECEQKTAALRALLRPPTAELIHQ